MRRDEVALLLREACSRYLWRAMPEWLESEVVDRAMAEIPEEDVDASPYGELFALAVEAVQAAQGAGRFVTLYDEAVRVGPARLADVSVGPDDPGFGEMRELGYRRLR